MKACVACCMVLLMSLVCEGAILQLHGDRASLQANKESLRSIAELFEAQGVSLVLDPALAENKITGQWHHIPIGRLVEQLAYPNNYVVSWKRIETPMGALDQVSRIIIMGEGTPDDVMISNRKRRTLDVVVGPDEMRYVRGEIMVGFQAGSSMKELKALLQRVGGTVLEVINPPGLYRIKIKAGMRVEEALAEAQLSVGVEKAEPNRVFSNDKMPAVSLSENPIGVNLNLEAGERAIAVFDSGIDPAYKDLPFMLEAYNAIDPGAAVDDPTGHGTLVALIASGAIVPEGMPANTAGVKVLPVCLFDENGYTSSHALFSALNYALDQGIREFNWSFGTDQPVPFFEAAIEAAVDRGARIYIASGNNGEAGSVYPASSPLTFSIGSGDHQGISSWSNYGDDVDAYYPGLVYFDGKRYIGTSFSTPYALYLNEPLD